MPRTLRRGKTIVPFVICFLTFTHASDYTIAIDTGPMDGEPETTSEPETPSESETPSEPEISTSAAAQETGSDGAITSPGTGNAAWNPWWIIVIGAFVIVVGVGVFFAQNIKKTGEK